MDTFKLKAKLDYLMRIGVEVDLHLNSNGVEIAARTQGVADKWYGDSRKLTYEEFHSCVVGQQSVIETTIDGLVKSVLTAASKANLEAAPNRAPVNNGAPHYMLPHGHPLTGNDVFKGWPPEWPEPERGF
jgi:hypothetical protein